MTYNHPTPDPISTKTADDAFSPFWPAPELRPVTNDAEAEARDEAGGFLAWIGGTPRVALLTRGRLDTDRLARGPEAALGISFGLDAEIEASRGRDTVVLRHSLTVRVSGDPASASDAAVAVGLPRPAIIKAGASSFLVWRGEADAPALAAVVRAATRQTVAAQSWTPIPGLPLREGSAPFRVAELIRRGDRRQLRPRDLSHLRVSVADGLDPAGLAGRLGCSVVRVDTEPSRVRSGQIVKFHRLDRCASCGRKGAALIEFEHGLGYRCHHCGKIPIADVFRMAGIRPGKTVDREEPEGGEMVKLLPLLHDLAGSFYEPVTLSAEAWGAAHGVPARTVRDWLARIDALGLARRNTPTLKDRRRPWWRLTPAGRRLLEGRIAPVPAALIAPEEVTAWLRAQVPGPAARIRANATAAGVSDWTLRQAARKLGIVRRKTGGSGASWEWTLRKEGRAVKMRAPVAARRSLPDNAAAEHPDVAWARELLGSATADSTPFARGRIEGRALRHGRTTETGRTLLGLLGIEAKPPVGCILCGIDTTTATMVTCAPMCRPCASDRVVVV